MDKMDEQNSNEEVVELPAVPSNADEGPPSADVNEEANKDEAMNSAAPESRDTNQEEDDSEMNQQEPEGINEISNVL